MGERLEEKGKLVGHLGWVTALATTPEDPDLLLSASRDKTIIAWQLTRAEEQYGFAIKSLIGHSHFVEDVVISSDGQFCLSASWDGSLRLWDIKSGETERRFIGHSKEVLSVAFSADNRQIVSGSRDKTIKLWNTLGECKFTDMSHTEWVSCVRFSPSTTTPLIVSCGWDKCVKVWNLSETTRAHKSLEKHEGYLNTVTVSPDGSLCASGGKDQQAMLWDLYESKHLYSLKADGIIHCLAFSPNRYWLCAGTSASIVIWDLESKVVVDEIRLQPSGKRAQLPYCASLCWSADGSTLFAGFTDNVIRVYHVVG